MYKQYWRTDVKVRLDRRQTVPTDTWVFIYTQYGTDGKLPLYRRQTVPTDTSLYKQYWRTEVKVPLDRRQTVPTDTWVFMYTQYGHWRQTAVI